MSSNTPLKSPGGVFHRSPGYVRGGGIPETCIVTGAYEFSIASSLNQFGELGYDSTGVFDLEIVECSGGAKADVYTQSADYLTQSVNPPGYRKVIYNTVISGYQSPATIRTAAFTLTQTAKTFSVQNINRSLVGSRYEALRSYIMLNGPSYVTSATALSSVKITLVSTRDCVVKINGSNNNLLKNVQTILTFPMSTYNEWGEGSKRITLGYCNGGYPVVWHPVYWSFDFYSDFSINAELISWT